MNKIFKEYGGIVVVVIAVVAVIGLVSFLMKPGGVLDGAFTTLVQTFVDKSDASLDAAGAGGSGGSGSGGSISLSGKTEVALLEGDNLTYNKSTPITLSFRSPAEYSTFEAVTVDGVVVDGSNYTVTEGSTVVTFTADYSQTLLVGEHEVAIISAEKYAIGTVNVISDAPAQIENIIPEGATYTTYVNGYFDEDGWCWTYDDVVTYSAGEELPATANQGDIYTYGNYEYCYGYSWCYDCSDGWANQCCNSYTTDGWAVRCINNVAVPGAILSSINGEPVTSMVYTFGGCSALTTPPAIPSSVSDMTGAFENCDGLTDLSGYIIPGSASMDFIFQDCDGLNVGPVISKLGSDSFTGCSNLATITYTGSTDEWNANAEESIWNANCGEIVVICNNGQVTVPAFPYP